MRERIPTSAPRIAGTPHREVLALVAMTLFALLPFTAKAFHIDDPLFLWTAAHLVEDPLDFYGFPVNWYGVEERMAEVNQNPPLIAYGLALVGPPVGWNERALHFAFLLPALALVVGTQRLARRFCAHPTLAATATLATPAVLVSSTGLMTDVPMVAGFVWSIELWLDGLHGRSRSRLFLAASTMSLAVLTKYFAIALVPLLLATTLVHRRRVTREVLWLGVPVATLTGFEVLARSLYGHGLFGRAASYAIDHRGLEVVALLERAMIGLSFTGGCVGLLLLLRLRRRPSRRALLAATTLPIVVAACIAGLGRAGTWQVAAGGGAVDGSTFVQLVFFASAGAAVLLLALEDLIRHRDAESLLLFLWVSGVFTFSTFLNWTTNARTILPLVPAVAILLVRSLPRNATVPARAQTGAWAAVAVAACLSLAVTASDFRLAEADRKAAGRIGERFGDLGERAADDSRTLWFQGHWGFQVYMEWEGAHPVDYRDWEFRPGDHLVVPLENTNVQLPPDSFLLVDEIREPTMTGLAVMDTSLGAGFYSELSGPLPFAFGRPGPRRFLVFRYEG